MGGSRCHERRWHVVHEDESLGWAVACDACGQVIGLGGAWENSRRGRGWRQIIIKWGGAMG
jgi:hypothetical protein